ncbi:hypothetical protein ABW19_dt0209864 [Dactylella cylindrospora]|nr:hypothetical protein ABW19_dt0209864 [Dactylella cylindrospora]
MNVESLRQEETLYYRKIKIWLSKGARYFLRNLQKAVRLTLLADGMLYLRSVKITDFLSVRLYRFHDQFIAHMCGICVRNRIRRCDNGFLLRQQDAIDLPRRYLTTRRFNHRCVLS